MRNEGKYKDLSTEMYGPIISGILTSFQYYTAYQGDTEMDVITIKTK